MDEWIDELHNRHNENVNTEINPNNHLKNNNKLQQTKQRIIKTTIIKKRDKIYI